MDLWPFAVKYAVYLWNRMPRTTTGLSPVENLYSTKGSHLELRNARLWGLRFGHTNSRQKETSEMGSLLQTRSISWTIKIHASSIGLIKNPRTGAISPQLHVLYHDHFTTTPSTHHDGPEAMPTNCQDLIIKSRENSLKMMNLFYRITGTSLMLRIGGRRTQMHQQNQLSLTKIRTPALIKCDWSTSTRSSIWYFDYQKWHRWRRSISNYNREHISNISSNAVTTRTKPSKINSTETTQSTSLQWTLPNVNEWFSANQSRCRTPNLSGTGRRGLLDSTFCLLQWLEHWRKWIHKSIPSAWFQRKRKCLGQSLLSRSNERTW